MENFFNVPLVLKDYKDLIPENYDDREYYEGKPVEGVIFLKKCYKNSWSDIHTFEILCYRIPHCKDHMCHLKTFELTRYPGRSLPKERIDEVVTQFYNDYVKDNIKGVHSGEFETNIKRMNSEIAEIQKDLNNFLNIREKFGAVKS